MRPIVIATTLIALIMTGTCPSCAKAPPSRQGTKKATVTAEAPKLKMIRIRAASSGDVKQLRSMPIDIVRIKPDPQRPPDKTSLAGGFIVEAVAPGHILPKLKAKGYEFSEVPARHEK